jgi:hypothetical protein
VSSLTDQLPHGFDTLHVFAGIFAPDLDLDGLVASA